MCGIVGIISKRPNGFYQSDVGLFSQMLVADAVRGIDGTGVFGVYGTGSVGWLKVGSHPYGLLTSKKFDAWSQAMVRRMDMVVGHNRKATAGKSSNENSHPFIHENIVLVHNGVVHNHKKMADTEVDSHAIAHSMVEKGYKETIATLDGAFALVWFDMKDRTMRFVRNSQRPLFLVENNTSLAFASEAGMLTWIGARNSLAGWDSPKELPEGVVMSISQEGRKISMEKVELYKFTPAYSNYPHTSAWEYDDEGIWTGSNAGIPATIPEDDEEVVVDSVAKTIRDDMPNLDEQEHVEIDEFINTYRDGKIVTFEARSMVPWASADSAIAGYNLDGVLRDDTTVRVRACFEGHNVFNNVKKLLDKKVVKGTIFGVLVDPVNGQKSLQVRHVTELGVYTTINGTTLTADEWYKLCDTQKCKKCNAKLKIGEITGTSVNIKSADNVRIFCPECVKAHVDKLPPEHKAQLERLNAKLKPLVGATERAWDLKGSTHGS